MATFDTAAWKAKAWARFERALASGKPKEKLERAWARDVLAIYDISVLNEWVQKRGLTLTFEKKQNGLYDSASRNISISCNMLPVNQSIYLLHECGHHLIGAVESHDRFFPGYPQGDVPGISRRADHRVSCLEEEFEAWHRGWKLARRLHLSVTRSEYDEIRLECLKTYIKWAARSQEKDK